MNRDENIQAYGFIHLHGVTGGAGANLSWHWAKAGYKPPVTHRADVERHHHTYIHTNGQKANWFKHPFLLIKLFLHFFQIILRL